MDGSHWQTGSVEAFAPFWPFHKLQPASPRPQRLTQLKSARPQRQTDESVPDLL